MTFSIIKDPEAVLDYAVDWGSQWLGVDVIAASSWSVSGPDGDLVVDTSSFTDDIATVWLSGGTLGGKYAVINHITTSEGREDDRTIVVTVGNK